MYYPCICTVISLVLWTVFLWIFPYMSLGEQTSTLLLSIYQLEVELPYRRVLLFSLLNSVKWLSKRWQFIHIYESSFISNPPPWLVSTLIFILATIMGGWWHCSVVSPVMPWKLKKLNSFSYIYWIFRHSLLRSTVLLSIKKESPAIWN